MAPFLTARWEDLVLVNHEVDPALLAPLVPQGVELEIDKGRALLSLVAFAFNDTRLKGVRVPLHHTFPEVNLRFYVQRHTPDGPRRGVVFVKEVVPRALLAGVARAVYHERYVARPMRMARHVEGEERRFGYAWREGDEWCEVNATVQGEPSFPIEGGHEHAVVDHLYGYVRRRDGTTREYLVDHPPWRLWQRAKVDVSGPLEAAYGPQFARALRQPPVSAFAAEGSAVVVHGVGQRVQ